MIIVESLALSTMMMNSLVMPAIFRFNHIKGFPTLILNIKRFIIIGCVFLGYFFAVFIGRFYSLVEIGLKSFEAVTIFAPPLILGLYWKKGNRNGAMAGIIAGFVIWFYTLLMPALIKAEVISSEGLLGFLLRHDFLNPHGLFGLKGLDKWSHSLFWGLTFNLIGYVGFSLFTAQKERKSGKGCFLWNPMTPNWFPRRVYTPSGRSKTSWANMWAKWRPRRSSAALSAGRESTASPSPRIT